MSDQEFHAYVRVAQSNRLSIVEFMSTGPTVRIGGLLLRELADGSLWLENEAGEGMQVASDKVEPLLRKFYNEHF